MGDPRLGPAEDEDPRLGPAEEPEPVPRSDTAADTARDFGMGVEEGATAGFAPKILGAAASLAHKAGLYDPAWQPGMPSDPGQSVHQSVREREGLAHERSPIVTGAGNVAGMAATTLATGGAGAEAGAGKALLTAGQRAALADAGWGAAVGLGHSEADTVGGQLADTAKGAAIGLLTGGAIRSLGKAGQVTAPRLAAQAARTRVANTGLSPNQVEQAGGARRLDPLLQQEGVTRGLLNRAQINERATGALERNKLAQAEHEAGVHARTTQAKRDQDVMRVEASRLRDEREALSQRKRPEPEPISPELLKDPALLRQERDLEYASRNFGNRFARPEPEPISPEPQPRLGFRQKRIVARAPLNPALADTMPAPPGPAPARVEGMRPPPPGGEDLVPPKDVPSHLRTPSGTYRQAMGAVPQQKALRAQRQAVTIEHPEHGSFDTELDQPVAFTPGPATPTGRPARLRPRPGKARTSDAFAPASGTDMRPGSENRVPGHTLQHSATNFPTMHGHPEAMPPEQRALWEHYQSFPRAQPGQPAQPAAQAQAPAQPRPIGKQYQEIPEADQLELRARGLQTEPTEQEQARSQDLAGRGQVLSQVAQASERSLQSSAGQLLQPRYGAVARLVQAGNALTGQRGLALKAAGLEVGAGAGRLASRAAPHAGPFAAQTAALVAAGSSDPAKDQYVAGQTPEGAQALRKQADEQE